MVTMADPTICLYSIDGDTKEISSDPHTTTFPFTMLSIIGIENGFEALRYINMVYGVALSIFKVGFILPKESNDVGLLSSYIFLVELSVKHVLFSQSIIYFGPQNCKVSVPFQYKKSYN